VVVVVLAASHPLSGKTRKKGAVFVRFGVWAHGAATAGSPRGNARCRESYPGSGESSRAGPWALTSARFSARVRLAEMHIRAFDFKKRRRKFARSVCGGL